MKQTKLVKLLRLLQKHQLKKLVEFMHSPYFNKDSQVIKLTEVLVKEAPDFLLESEKCFQQIFPNEKFDGLKLRRIFSKAFQLTEQFLVAESIQEKDYLKHKLLSDYYYHKVENKAFKKHNKAWKENLQNLPWDIQALELFTIDLRQWNFDGFLTEKYAITLKERKLDQLGNQLLESLERLIGRLLFQMNAGVNITNFNKNIQFNKHPFLEDLIELTIKKQHIQNWQEEPMILEAFYGYQIVEGSSDKEAFEALKKIRDTHATLPDTALFDICTSIGLHCMTLHYKTLDPIYLEERLNNYMIQLKRGLSFRDGFFIPQYFGVMVDLALKLNKIDWTKQFIKKYTSALPEKQQEAVKWYSLGLTAFREQNYSQVTKYLGNINTSRYFYFFYRYKVLQMKAFYELKEYTLLESLLNSFRVLLSRTNSHVSKAGKLRGRNFINALSQLFKFSPMESKAQEKLLALQKKIDETYSDSGWLMEKVEEKLEELGK